MAEIQLKHCFPGKSLLYKMCAKSQSKIFIMTELIIVFVAVVCIFQVSASPLPGSGEDDNRYVEREYPSASPGAHELATWLITQLRQTNQQQANSIGNDCKYRTAVKRNSEIINSLLRLPPQIDNGRK